MIPLLYLILCSMWTDIVIRLPFANTLRTECTRDGPRPTNQSEGKKLYKRYMNIINEQPLLVLFCIIEKHVCLCFGGILSGASSFVCGCLCLRQVDFVKKTSMYGYQADAQIFAQVWLRDPGDVSAVVALLEVLVARGVYTMCVCVYHSLCVSICMFACVS